MHTRNDEYFNQKKEALFSETQPILWEYFSYEIYKNINIHHLILHKKWNVDCKICELAK